MNFPETPSNVFSRLIKTKYKFFVFARYGKRNSCFNTIHESKLHFINRDESSYLFSNLSFTQLQNTISYFDSSLIGTLPVSLKKKNDNVAIVPFWYNLHSLTMAFAKRLIASLLVSSDVLNISLTILGGPMALPLVMVLIAATIFSLVIDAERAQEHRQQVAGYLFPKGIYHSGNFHNDLLMLLLICLFLNTSFYFFFNTGLLSFIICLAILKILLCLISASFWSLALFLDLYTACLAFCLPFRYSSLMISPFFWVSLSWFYLLDNIQNWIIPPPWPFTPFSVPSHFTDNSTFSSRYNFRSEEISSIACELDLDFAISIIPSLKAFLTSWFLSCYILTFGVTPYLSYLREFNNGWVNQKSMLSSTLFTNTTLISFTNFRSQTFSTTGKLAIFPETCITRQT